MNAKQARTARRKLNRERGHLIVAMRLAGAPRSMIDYYSDFRRTCPRDPQYELEELIARTP